MIEPEAVIARGEAETEATAERLAGTGLTDAELEACKRQLKGQVTLSLESVAARMYRAAATELYGRRFRELDEVLAEIDAVGLAQVNQLCHDFFRADAQTLVRLGPAA